MTSGKQPASEPFLNTVARKLGYAAGTLTNVAHGFTNNRTSLPAAASARVPSAAQAATDSMSHSNEGSGQNKHGWTGKRSAEKAKVPGRRKPAAKRMSPQAKPAKRKKS